MSVKKSILLPGLDKQFEFLQKNLTAKVESALVIGSSSEKPAELIAKNFSCSVNLIVQDYESLLNSRLILVDSEKVKISLMDFEITDFDAGSFDLIYAQASISITNRNKIIKEIKRLLKPEGYLCVGEIVSLEKKAPTFMKDIFDSSDLLPLFVDELEEYFAKRDFQILTQQDLTNTLKEYYSKSFSLLKEIKENLTEQEKSFYKKLLNKVNHESNAYLKLGGNRFIGFIALLLQKGK